jgi:hypothetical protein
LKVREDKFEGDFALALLGDESGDTVAFFGEVDWIGYSYTIVSRQLLKSSLLVLRLLLKMFSI